MHKLGAFAIILDEQSRVLLCHRTDRDAWDLPGGGVEPDESPWDAVVREVREEAGIEVRVARLLGVYAVPHEQKVTFSFLCVRTGGELHPRDETDDAQWFARDHLPANTLPRHAARIQDAFDMPGDVLLRTVDRRG